jgi:RNA 2',3'-cyclic 3'-phosphodiesterase
MISNRIFIAINLPENIKKKLMDFEVKHPDLPARWTKQDSLHITLDFIGNATDDEVYEICRIAKSVAENSSVFQIVLNKICYGPPKEELAPRMVWAMGEKSEEFASIKKDLDEALCDSQKLRFSPENKGFSPHITLARIRQWDFKKIEPEERPVVDEDTDFSFEASSIEVMDSELKRGGPKYTIIGSFPLKQ